MDRGLDRETTTSGGGKEGPPLLRHTRLTVVLLGLMLLVGLGTVTAQDQRAEAGGAPVAGSGSVEIAGPVRVIDGDTIEAFIHGRRVGVGLIGIDAPMGNTACGRTATAALQLLTQGGSR